MYTCMHTLVELQVCMKKFYMSYWLATSYSIIVWNYFINLDIAM